MKKTIFILVLFCGAALAFSFKGKTINEGESDFVIVTRNYGSLIITYGNEKSEIIDLKSSSYDKSIISNNEVLLIQLNKLRSLGYEIKTTISSGTLNVSAYTILLAKK